MYEKDVERRKKHTQFETDIIKLSPQSPTNNLFATEQRLQAAVVLRIYCPYLNLPYPGVKMVENVFILKIKSTASFPRNNLVVMTFMESTLEQNQVKVT